MYFELYDRLTGKTYPGYILLDKIIKNDGTIIYGIATKNKRDYLIYKGLSTTNPVIVKKQNIKFAGINTRQDKNDLKYLEKHLGKINFEELIKYYASEKQNLAESKTSPATADISRTAPEQIVKKVSKKRSPKKTILKKKKKTTDKRTIIKKMIPVEKKNDTNILSLGVRKLIIKFLALLIVVWLSFMGYKMYKSMR